MRCNAHGKDLVISAPVDSPTARYFLDRSPVPGLIRAGSHGDLKPRERPVADLSLLRGGGLMEMLVFLQLRCCTKPTNHGLSPPPLCNPRLWPGAARRTAQQPTDAATWANSASPTRASVVAQRTGTVPGPSLEAHFCSSAAMSSSAGNLPEDPIRRHRTRPVRCGVWDSILPG
jgi:hypothetical protein